MDRELTDLHRVTMQRIAVEYGVSLAFCDHCCEVYRGDEYVGEVWFPTDEPGEGLWSAHSDVQQFNAYTSLPTTALITLIANHSLAAKAVA